MNEPVSDSGRGKWIDAVVPIAFIVAWLAVQAFVLPRFGVCTSCCGGVCSLDKAPKSQDVPSTDPTVSRHELPPAD
jgi:hypothetical protein